MVTDPFEERTLADSIQAHFGDLTKSHQKAAEVLVRDPGLAAFASASEIARRAGVSEATVTRLAYALGFQGFAEMQNYAQQNLARGRLVEKHQVAVDELAGADSLVKRIMELDVANIRSTIAGIRLEDFDRAVEMIGTAERIHVIGLRSSGSVSHFLAFLLGSMFGNTELISPGEGDLPNRLVSLGPGSLLIAIAFPRYTRETVRTVTSASQRGAKILSITDSKLSPLAQKADVSLTVSIDSLFFSDSYVAALSLANALLAACGARYRDRVLGSLNRLEEFYREFDLFWTR